MTEEITLPRGLKLRPQEHRVFTALASGWCDENAIRQAINEPNGQVRHTPANVITSKLRVKLKEYALAIESRRMPPKKSEWRLARAEPVEAAA